MSETSAPATPASAEAAAPSSAAADPLAGDWSQGLPGPVRPHGLPQPTLFAFHGATPAPPPMESAQPPMDSAQTAAFSRPAELAPPAALAAPSPAPPSETAPTPWSEP